MADDGLHSPAANIAPNRPSGDPPRTIPRSQSDQNQQEGHGTSSYRSAGADHPTRAHGPPVTTDAAEPDAAPTTRDAKDAEQRKATSPPATDPATDPANRASAPMATQQRTGGSNSSNNSNGNNNTSSTNNGRLTRIRKACDICRLRKVKCDGVSPCKPCQSLGADCTFQYVSRHRGPTSRFAAGNAWSATATANAGANNANNADDSQDVNVNVHDGFGDASDVFASLYVTPQPMTLPQVPPLPEALSSLPQQQTQPLPMYRNDTGMGSSMPPPQSPSSVASATSHRSSASPSLQAVPYSTSFFDAVATNARRSPAAPPGHLHTPHINIYPRMPRPQIHRQPPPKLAQFPSLPQIPLPPAFHQVPPPPPPLPPPPSSQPTLSSDAIAPLHVLELLVDDFFTYIHPLIPFPHEPTFRRRFALTESRQEPGFLALLASMIGTLAASFPRSVRAHLKAKASLTTVPGVPPPASFTRAVAMVACCRDVALSARGAAFYTKPVLSVDDAATSYFLGLAAGYTFDWHLCRRFMAEAMSFVQELGFHRRPPDNDNQNGSAQPAAGAAMLAAMNAIQQASGGGGGPGNTATRRFNHVEDQIGKRIFWILYLAMRSLIQLGATLSETPLPPFNNARPFPDLPAEVDDAYIEPDVIHPQPPGTVSLITGYNKTIQIYATMDPIATMEYACGLHHVPVPAQRAMFIDALQAAKAITDTLPDELYLPLPGNEHNHGGHGHGHNTGHGGTELLYDDLPGYRYYPPAEYDNDTSAYGGTTRRDSTRSNLSNGNSGTGFNPAYSSYGTPGTTSTTANTNTAVRPDDLRLLLGNHPARRRQVQYDIQKTNIYASQLATRSYFVEMYMNLGNDTDSDTLSPMHGERERIVHSLLFVLAAIPQCNMEPNGSALINKIRQVASTLLAAKPSSTTSADDSTRAMEAQLMRFLEILMRLERTGGPAGGAMNSGSMGGLGMPGFGGLAGMGGLGGFGGMGAGMGSDDEEEELRSWASLREEQMRFAANGGFLGLFGV
ncbi:hypothetical protein SEUCBS139899_000485 [Sporothrix eucalyptigena]|uniref:Zn(2)-C6 fungal-type domain-containing protein n=1 Tax=Sporothrix eucalyptigena TaxID=1812306 RepID=A0ABP0BBU9_9PEZI